MWSLDCGPQFGAFWVPRQPLSKQSTSTGCIPGCSIWCPISFHEETLLLSTRQCCWDLILCRSAPCVSAKQQATGWSVSMHAPRLDDSLRSRERFLGTFRLAPFCWCRPSRKCPVASTSAQGGALNVRSHPRALWHCVVVQLPWDFQHSQRAQMQTCRSLGCFDACACIS